MSQPEVIYQEEVAIVDAMARAEDKIEMICKLAEKYPAHHDKLSRDFVKLALDETKDAVKLTGLYKMCNYFPSYQKRLLDGFALSAFGAACNDGRGLFEICRLSYAGTPGGPPDAIPLTEYAHTDLNIIMARLLPCKLPVKYQIELFKQFILTFVKSADDQKVAIEEVAKVSPRQAFIFQGVSTVEDLQRSFSAGKRKLVTTLLWCRSIPGEKKLETDSHAGFFTSLPADMVAYAAGFLGRELQAHPENAVVPPIDHAGGGGAKP